MKQTNRLVSLGKSKSGVATALQQTLKDKDFIELSQKAENFVIILRKGKRVLSAMGGSPIVAMELMKLSAAEMMKKLLEDK